MRSRVNIINLRINYFRDQTRSICDIARTFYLPRGNARTETKCWNIRDFKVCKLLAISRRFNNTTEQSMCAPQVYIQVNISARQQRMHARTRT